MKLRLNTGFEGVTRFVILRLIRHLAVEARHCVRRFARHFIKIWRVSRSTLMWTFFQWTFVIIYWQGKVTSFLTLLQEFRRYLTHLFRYCGHNSMRDNQNSQYTPALNEREGWSTSWSLAAVPSRHFHLLLRTTTKKTTILFEILVIFPADIIIIL